MAAVAEPPVEDVIAKPHRAVKFAARAEELCLVYSPTYYQLGPHGQRTGTLNQDAARFSFKVGTLEVPEDGTVLSDQGRPFPAKELLAWLRGHRLYGDQTNGFWEIPAAAPPVSDEEFEAVTLASAMADLPRLRALLDAESKGWARPTLLKALRASIERLEEFQAQIEAQEEQRQLEEAQPPAKKPAAKAKPAPKA